MHITISSTGRGRFNARLGDRLLYKSTETPFYSAARVLLREGVPPETPLTMAHEGDEDVVCMSSTVGAAARLTIRDDDGGVRVVPYRAFQGL